MSRISERLRYVGVNDLDKTLFEGLWPLPYGVTYNSYLIVDEKIALMDTVEHGFADELLARIREEIGDRPVDYIVVNHMEPDHSSSLVRMREAYPDVRIVCNAKAVPMLAGFYGITDNILVIKDKDVLSLGESTLTFHLTPMVHWPETMMTYCPEERTLFSGDAFGTFGAEDDDFRDCCAHLHHFPDGRDEGTEPHYGSAAQPVVTSSSDTADAGRKDTLHEFEIEIARYYSNVVGKYGVPVQNALKKLATVDIGRICSTHGPVWEGQVSGIIDVYDRLSRYEGRRGVCIAYASMYGNTAAAAKALAADLDDRGIPYGLHNLCIENPSYAYRDAFLFDTLAIGSATYNGDIMPPVKSFIAGLDLRTLKNRRFLAFGSHSWTDMSVKRLNEFAVGRGFEMIGEGVPFEHAYSPEKVKFPQL